MLDQSPPVEHTYDEPIPASIAVIQALAAIDDVDPIDLSVTLYDYVNPDALDMLIGHKGATGTVEIRFAVEGRRVSVRDTGEVRVRDLDE